MVLAGTIAVFAGALGFAWSGLGDIAASQGHWPFVDRFLEFGMRNAVATHAKGIETPPLEDPNLIRLGAGHFHRGCAFCHGAPGISVNPIAERMLPQPPDLSTAMRPWKDHELFWIIKHGFKYTGMPGWVAIERDDEIWAVVAFVKRLPQLDAAGYSDLALGKVQLSPQSGLELATLESNPKATSACARCHGAEEELPLSDLVPALHGQPVDFLLSALKAYAKGDRRSGIMQPLAADLRAEDMQQLAAFYAGLKPPEQPPPGNTDAALIEGGRKLALEGLPDAGVPACVGCHGSANFPRLAGQHAAYMAGQLRLWKRGHAPTTEGASVMVPIAQQLSDEQIKAVSAYFATAPPAPREPGLP